MKTLGQQELSIKVLKGEKERKRKDSVWMRFDRLQRSLRPLRKDRHIPPGLYYGEQSRDQRS